MGVGLQLKAHKYSPLVSRAILYRETIQPAIIIISKEPSLSLTGLLGISRGDIIHR